jgi:hypothetical protein
MRRWLVMMGTEPIDWGVQSKWRHSNQHNSGNDRGYGCLFTLLVGVLDKLLVGILPWLGWEDWSCQLPFTVLQSPLCCKMVSLWVDCWFRMMTCDVCCVIRGFLLLWFVQARRNRAPLWWAVEHPFGWSGWRAVNDSKFMNWEQPAKTKND